MSAERNRKGISEERQRRSASPKAKYAKILPRETSLDKTREDELIRYLFERLKDVPSEMIRRLLREFDSTASAVVLAAKLVSLGVAEKNLWPLLDRIHDLKYATHERQPVHTSVLLVPDGTPVDRVGRLTSTPSQALHISERSDFLSFVQCADGFRSGVLIRPTGEVLGTFSFHPEAAIADHLLPERYQAACRASASSCGLLFLFAGNGRVCIFQNGRRILSHRGNTWHIHTDDIQETISRLCERHSIDESLLTEITRVAFRISDEGQGALITVGDQAAVLKVYEPKVRARDVSAMRIGETPHEDLVLLMSQDGATIIATDCSIVGAEGFLRPPPHTNAQQETHRGSRHNTAIAVSAITQAVCAAVSVDGSVTLYSRGEREWSG